MRHVFLDYQSSTPVLPEVLDAMRPFWATDFGNPSSIHQFGVRARQALAKAREQIAAFINAPRPEDIIFTSGGTEAANLAVKGTAYAHQRRGQHLVSSDIEHPSVLESIEFLKAHGFISTRVPVDSTGLIEPEAVRSALTPETILISVQHANHDIGAVEPIDRISDIVAEAGIPFFIDATASAGWLPIDVQKFNCSLLSLAPHRFYGPKGVGILYRNSRARLASILHGGNQEAGHRAGIENVPAIVGAGAAAEIAQRDRADRAAQAAKLQRQLWEGLQSSVPYLRLNGPEPGPNRLPANLNLSVEFIEGEGLALALDMQGISAATGPSCVAKALQVPPALAAIKIPPSLARSNILFSLGIESTPGEIDYVIERFGQVVNKLRSMSEPWEEFNRGIVDSVIHPRQPSGSAATAQSHALSSQ